MPTQNLDRRLQLVPPGSKPRLLMFVLCMLLPLAIITAALLWEPSELSRISGQSTRNAWAVLGGTTSLVLLVWFALDRAMLRHRLQIEAGELSVKTSFYSRTIPLADLLLEQARIIDLDEGGDFTPRFKTNGYALPGFRSGHFRLRNGHKAFVAIAGERRALWLPAAHSQGLLLQPAQPEALLQHLRELAAAGARG